MHDLSKNLLLFALGSSILMGCEKEKGCTDPLASNFDGAAEKACDDCCTYSTQTDTSGQMVVITDMGEGTGTTTWRSDKTYILDGFVFVNAGQTLTIEPGTVIKGKAGQGSNASALIVAKNGTIMAEGTASAPIVFTFENDPLDGSIPVQTKGQWGGVIVLGNARLNSSPGSSQIEGIPTSETRGLYGGNNDADNSGVLKYISIRHGGTDIGAGNEINGLTLGGVGSGTTIEYIEVISNADDGIEFFGGTARVKYALVAFCGDDSYDYDQGYRGFGQFWVAIQEPAEGNRGGEHDGGTSPEDGTPYAHPMIYNATYIGRGISEAEPVLTFRDNAAGEYHNSIFYNWGKGVDIENLASGQDSYERFTNNELVLAGNVFWEVNTSGVNASVSDIFTISMGDGWPSATDSLNSISAANSAFQSSFQARGNQITDPGLSANFSQGGYALTGHTISAYSTANDPWFETASFTGALDPSGTNWLKSWTLLDGYQPSQMSSSSYLD